MISNYIVQTVTAANHSLNDHSSKEVISIMLLNYLTNFQILSKTDSNDYSTSIIRLHMNR